MFKTRFQILGAILLTLTAISVSFAAAPVNIAVKALSQKLKSDLAVEDVDLKLNRVETWNVSRTEVRIKGTGAANDLPLNFEVKVDKIKAVPTDVVYVFTNPVAAPTAVADTQDILTRDLLDKMSKDYKTENVVVSIDGFDTTQKGSLKSFTGTGDLRVGFEWSKIDFDITIDSKTNLPVAIKYQVKQ